MYWKAKEMYCDAINWNAIQWLSVVPLCSLHSESAPSSSPDFCPIPQIPHPGLISNASPHLPASPPTNKLPPNKRFSFSQFLLPDSTWTDIHCVFDDMLLRITQKLFQLLNCSENLGSDTVVFKRLEEENQGHIVVKAIYSRRCLVVIIWCADVPTHLRQRYCCPSHRPTVGGIGSGVNGHYWSFFFQAAMCSCPKVVHNLM